MFANLIKELQEKNIKISFYKGKLQYCGPEQLIDEKLITILKENKAKLLKHFWPEECGNMMPINTEGEKMPIVMIHAGPSNYAISENLGKDQPFYGFFYIGSDGEKIRYKTVEAFAAEYLKQLQYIIPNDPVILGGFSIGGNLAYEMAIQLQRQGINVPLLIIVDSILPAFVETVNYNSSIKRLFAFTYNVIKNIFYGIINYIRKLVYEIFTTIYDKLPKDKRKKYIIWTYSVLLKKYKPVEKFQGDMLLFKADKNISQYKNLGWEKICDNIKMIYFEGDHGAMYNEKATIDLIKNSISEWLSNSEVTN